MANRRATQHIVIHTSATRAIQDIGVGEIRKWHKAQGWTDIGYHFVIRRDGTVQRGRARDAIGSHVKGWNAITLGICMVGGLANKAPYAPENNYTPAQWKALEALIRELLKVYPKATILGHRDLSPDKNRDGKISPNEWVKQCPCFEAKAWAKSRGLPAAK